MTEYLLIYGFSLMISTFAVSGINFDHLIKKNHAKEARLLAILIIIALGHSLASLILLFLGLGKPM